MEASKAALAEEMDAGIPLTLAALARVLQQLPVKERLGACALVSRAWRTAAAAATTKVELLGCTQRTCSSLKPWLASSRNVESIAVAARFDSRILAADAWVNNTPDSTAWRMPELQLPYGQLGGLKKLSLKLIRCTATTTAMQGKASKGSLAGLTGLQELSVTDCVIPLHGLPALTALERLELSQGWGAPQAWPGRGSAAAGPAQAAALAAAEQAPSCVGDAMPGAALLNLTRITHLSLAGSCCCEAAFAHVQHLEHLQELVLGWAELPQPMVAGCEAWSLGVSLDDANMPGLSKLTRLQKLVVAGAVEAVDPALLQGLPASLRHLQLDDCRLVMTLGKPRLAVLSSFKQLQHLSINNKRGPLSFLAAEDCHALTASSRLTYLGLTGCEMPADGCSRMFDSEWQLPCLQKLEAAPSILTDPAAVALLSICCPRLDSLVVQLPSATTQRLVGPVSLSGLQQVSGLQTLVLTGVTVSGSSGFRALGELTGLEQLVISALRGFRLADVMLLTSCKALRYLKLMHMQLTDVLAASLCLTHQGREDRPANVWAQLPPALLKQALWLYPFRSLPTTDELQQVTELINAQQMHFLIEVEASAPSPLAALQQQVISLALALLQVQQQRKSLAAAAATALGHPVLQQLQQQTQRMRELLIKLIADQQECVKNPQHIQRLQLSGLTDVLGVQQQAVTGGTGGPSLPFGVGMGAATASMPLLHQHQQQQMQQQLELQQALDATQTAGMLGLGGGMSHFLVQPQQQLPLMGGSAFGGSAGLSCGLSTSSAMTASSLLSQLQQLQLRQQQQPKGVCQLNPAGIAASSAAADAAVPAAGLLPLLQQQQDLLSQGASTLSQLLLVPKRQGLTANPPPAFAGPPPGLTPPGLAAAPRAGGRSTSGSPAKAVQAAVAAAVAAQGHTSAFNNNNNNNIMALLALQQQQQLGLAGLHPVLLAQLEQQQQQAYMMAAQELALQQQLNLLHLQQRFQPQTPQQQQQQQLEHIMQLQALAGLQTGIGGLTL